jgi:hypothetical protein
MRIIACLAWNRVPVKSVASLEDNTVHRRTREEIVTHKSIEVNVRVQQHITIMVTDG